MQETPVLFDPTTAWRALSPTAQEAIGVAAIIHTLGGIGVVEAAAPMQAFTAAEAEGFRALEEAIRGHLSEAFADDIPLRPDLAGIGIQPCRACGCTQDVACPEGCFWVDADLCSTCAGEP